jgi:hypothetical protein
VFARLYVAATTRFHACNGSKQCAKKCANYDLRSTFCVVSDALVKTIHKDSDQQLDFVCVSCKVGSVQSISQPGYIRSKSDLSSVQ